MKCLRCKTENCKEVTRTRFMVTRGLELEVDGLTNWLCSECGSEFETADQADHNTELVKSAFIAARSSEKQRLGLLSGSEIKAIREQYKLTQAEAAKIFGGGLRAFSKYENEEIVQAESMDRLLRCANKFEEVVVWLGARHGVAIEDRLYQPTISTNFVFSSIAQRDKPASILSLLVETIMPKPHITSDKTWATLISPKVMPVNKPTTPQVKIDFQYV